METIKVDILNPKAKNILKGLADLNLIKIRKEEKKSDFAQLLAKLRDQTKPVPDLDEIAKEVESVRKIRYEN